MRPFVFGMFAVVCMVLAPECAKAGFESSTLTIVHARYGLHDQRVDVTDAIRSLVEHNAVYLAAPWALGQVDPAFGSLKNVIIVYRVGDKQYSDRFDQHQDIQIPKGK